jgi:hypothetical protein
LPPAPPTPITVMRGFSCSSVCGIVRFKLISPPKGLRLASPDWPVLP